MVVYDETHPVNILRDNKLMKVPFCELKNGDSVIYVAQSVVLDGDAHLCEDPSYPGWLFFDRNGNKWFPENFGAKPKAGTELTVEVKLNADDIIKIRKHYVAKTDEDLVNVIKSVVDEFLLNL